MKTFTMVLILAIIGSVLTGVITYFGRGINWTFEVWVGSTITIGILYLSVPFVFYLFKI